MGCYYRLGNSSASRLLDTPFIGLAGHVSQHHPPSSRRAAPLTLQEQRS